MSAPSLSRKRRRPLKRIIAKALGFRTAQKELDRIIQRLQYYSGIGAGDGAGVSGEVAVFALLKQKLQPPYVIIDGGANRGQFLAEVLGNLRGYDVQIHCFEPAVAAFKELSKSAASHSFVYSVPMALGKEESDALLYSNEAGSQLASLSQRNLDHFHLSFEHSETVKVTTLDCYCDKQDIERISLLKLDLEGHELEALNGSRGMLDNKAIDAITFEFGGANIDSKTYFRDLWAFLKDKKYAVYRITPCGYFFQLISYKEYYEQFRTTNFLATPEP